MSDDESPVDTANPKTMTMEEGKRFIADLEAHAAESALRHFNDNQDDDEHLARGPAMNEGFNDFLRERDMNWATFERDDKYFARYCFDQYSWIEGYTFRKLLVQRYRTSIN